MKTLIFASALLLGVAMFGTGTCAAQTSSGPSLYKLEPTSAFETGCFGPCECPVFERPLQGTFSLQPDGFDPLFTRYKVTDVRWIVTGGPADVAIRGSGTYKVGGEFAVQQQLSLDLSVDGGALQHFDSGLVLGGGEFPRIDIDISLHQNTACIDTVMHVEAVDPVVTGVDAGSDPSKALRTDAVPNPFHGQTTFRMSLRHSGPLEAVVYDVRGRAVRHLMSATWVPAGFRTVSWDGRRDQGTECAAGVYFLGMRVGADRTMTRIVKLD